MNRFRRLLVFYRFLARVFRPPKGSFNDRVERSSRCRCMAVGGSFGYTECMWKGLMLAALLGGCGGSTQAHGNDEGKAVGGSAATGGTGGSGAASPMETAEWLQELDLDDSFPWFVGGPGQELGPMQPAEGTGTDKVLHVLLADSPAQAVISTHNHFDALSAASAVGFSARATTEVELLVSVRRALDSDYFSALASGQPWPVASVVVGPEWQDYEVAFANMKPADDSQASGTPAFTIAFIVDETSAPLELWFDNVHFE